MLSITFVVATLALVLFHRKAPRDVPEKSNVTAAMLSDARTNARETRKFLMVQFGADWCSDCRELSNSLQQETMRDYLKEHFVVFKIDVGEFNRNLDIAQSLGVDVMQGIPVAVFFAPIGSSTSTRQGTDQILAYLKAVAE